jgi:uncharacterized membrane protein
MLKNKTLTKEEKGFDVFIKVVSLLFRVSVATTLIFTCLCVVYLLYMGGYYGLADIMDNFMMTTFALLIFLMLSKLISKSINKDAK